MPTATHPDYEERLASAGVARTGVEVKIVGEDGRELPAGEIGEIVTRSDCVMQGYWNNPEANAKIPARRLAVDRRPRHPGRGRLRSPSRTAPRT